MKNFQIFYFCFLLAYCIEFSVSSGLVNWIFSDPQEKQSFFDYNYENSFPYQQQTEVFYPTSQHENYPEFYDSTAYQYPSTKYHIEYPPATEDANILGHDAISILFNPPPRDVQQIFCQGWNFINGIPEEDYAQNFEFSTESFGPGDVYNISGDGNCGFRAISWALTGTEENHIIIRKKIIKFIKNSIEEHKSSHTGDQWWLMFEEIKKVKKHLKDAKEPAGVGDSGNMDKWASNLDFLAGAKLFDVNIIVFDPVKPKGYRWQFFSPDTTSDWNNQLQNRDIYSIFLYQSTNHYDVITKPEELEN